MKKANLSIALLGPAVIGGIVGLEQSPSAASQAAVSIPVITALVAGLMLPALYIGVGLVGDLPRPRALATSMLRATQSSGHASIGMAIPLAFLLSTTRSVGLASVVGGAVIAIAAVCGLRVLRDEAIGADPDPPAWWIYNIWSVTALGIGARLYIDAMPKGGL